MSHFQKCSELGALFHAEFSGDWVLCKDCCNWETVSWRIFAFAAIIVLLTLGEISMSYK